MTHWIRRVAIACLVATNALADAPALSGQSPQAIAPSAQSILDAAIKQAQAEKKNIFVEFGASWCGPCIQLEKFLEAPAVKFILSRTHVIVRLVVLERGSKEKLNNPGTEELLRKWNNNLASIPFYLVLDQAGQPIPNASGSGFGRPGVSPGSAIASLFERTSTGITPAARRTLLDYFAVPTAHWTSTSQQLIWTETGRFGTSGLTPDGRWGVFTDGSQLFMREFATGAEKRLADLPGTGFVWRRQVFSPDGRQLAFVWMNRASGTQQLQVVDASSASAAVPRVLFEPGPSVDVILEDWSRDSGLIAVKLDGGKRTARLGVISTTDGSFRLLNEVAQGDAPNRMLFAPAGQRLAMQLPDSGGSSDVWIVSLDGKTRFPAAVGPSDERPVGWSRDSRHLLFRSDRTGSPALWAVEVKDAGVGEATVVSSQLGHFEPLGLDDAGNLYYRPVSPLNKTSILELDPKAPEIAATADGGPAFSGHASLPVWSADGQFIAYVQDQRGVGGRLRLIVRRVGTGDVKELMPDIPRFGPMSGHLRWSPDGRTLMFIWDWSADGSQMYAIDIQTGSTRLIASTDQWYSQSDMLPERSVLRHWTKDNKLYFDRGVGEGAKDIAIIEHELSSGREREVFRGPAGWVHRLALSPDGGTVFVKRPAGEGKTPPQDLVARDLRTGAERVLVARQHFGDLILSPDGRYLVFDMREDPASKERVFAVVPTSGGAARQLPAMSMFYSWLPDATGIIARSDGPWDESTHYMLVPLDGSPVRPITALGSDPMGMSVSPTGAHLAFHQWPNTPAPGQIWRMDLQPPGSREIDGVRKPPSLTAGVVAAGAAETARNPDPVTWTLAVAPNARFLSGRTFNAIVTATIEPGWHLYALSQPAGGPIAMSVTVPKNHPFSLAGKVMEPLPARRVERNVPAADATGPRRGGVVIVFSTDASRWTYPSRFLRYAPVSDQGAYAVNSLPEGEYWLAWVPSLEPNSSGETRPGSGVEGLRRALCRLGQDSDRALISTISGSHAEASRESVTTASAHASEALTAGTSVRTSPPFSRKLFTARIPSSSTVSRQSATNAGLRITARLIPSRASLTTTSSV